MIQYFVIAAVAFLTAVSTGFMAEAGLDWYSTIALPIWTPPNKIFGMVWLILFLLVTASAMLLWTMKLEGKDIKRRNLLSIFFAINVGLVLLYIILFFWMHLLVWSFIELIFLLLTILFLMYGLWPLSRIASLILIPYILWVIFAGVLLYNVILIN